MDTPPKKRSGPIVSVIIPCYDQTHFLPGSIESALAQTHAHVEVVVVDDGPTDNTSEIAKRYGVNCVKPGALGRAQWRNPSEPRRLPDVFGRGRPSDTERR